MVIEIAHKVVSRSYAFRENVSQKAHRRSSEGVIFNIKEIRQRSYMKREHFI